MSFYSQETLKDVAFDEKAKILRALIGRLNKRTDKSKEAGRDRIEYFLSAAESEFLQDCLKDYTNGLDVHD